MEESEGDWETVDPWDFEISDLAIVELRRVALGLPDDIREVGSDRVVAEFYTKIELAGEAWVNSPFESSSHYALWGQEVGLAFTVDLSETTPKPVAVSVIRET